MRSKWIVMSGALVFWAASLTVGMAGFSAPLAQACDGEAHAAAQSSSTGSQEPSFALTEAGPQKAVFQVNGIMCKSCEKKIQAALSKVQGVKSVTFLKAGSRGGIRLAQVTYESGSQVTPAQLAQAVQGAGFKATLTQ
jgi:copper chaperone CopZ